MLMCPIVTVDESHCEEIASYRRTLRIIKKKSLLFLDETAMRISAAPRTTIVMPGEKQYVVATETSSYARRYDMIAVVNGDKTFAPMIYTPEDRKALGVDGITTSMLLKFIDQSMA